ncbi:UNVERIFIED_CONTAM: hypothetical protein Sradi_4854600 [Sesamum radiatum]|uniref:Uncharacterized protein n=1 Tax=Sesamum radiatum TaxID=300843 RepID=A0AAW2MYS2_SESRA
MIGTTQAEVPEERPWLLHVDGSSTAQGSEASVVITSPQGEDMEFAIKFDFKTSKKQSRIRGLGTRYEDGQDVGASHLLAYSDSQLIVKQVNGSRSQGRQHDTIPPANRGVKDKVLELPATTNPQGRER